MSETPPPVSASGGIVIRFVSGEPEVVVVHRPAYDDWSFPKGKDESGETHEQTAIREVAEETGVLTRIVGELGKTEYRVSKGAKRVHWFLMRPVAGGSDFSPNNEVDEIRWVSPSAASDLLTYQHDRDLLGNTNTDTDHGTIYVVRHGDAGKRSGWSGDDLLRPLSPDGEAQGVGVASLLETAQVERIISSPAVRCVQTMEPLADRIGVPLEIDPRLREDATIEETAALIEELTGANVVVCTHGELVRHIVEDLAETGEVDRGKRPWPKGATWAITVDGGRFREASYLGPPQGVPR